MIRFPNEAELPSAVLLAWPHEATDWRPWLAEIDHCYSEYAAKLSHHAPLILLYHDNQHQRHIQRLLDRADCGEHRIHFIEANYNDTWVRDYGPLTILQNEQLQLLDFQFNAWGGKYPAEADNLVNRHLQAHGLFKAPFTCLDTILEGGSLDTDGEGTLLTTSQCLLTETRNIGFGKTEWERVFQQQLGIQKVLWLQHGGLIGDDTDSHVDMLARFCANGAIACSQCNDPDDVHYAPLTAMRQELEIYTSAAGESYELYPLPLPQPIFEDDHRLPASYANFLVVNEAVFMPVYDDPMDDFVRQQLEQGFPGYRIVPVNARPLIRQFGSLHCASMQIPLQALNLD